MVLPDEPVEKTSLTIESDRGCAMRGRQVRHLLALGTGKRYAILTAINSKSYWHLSKTLATQTGMTNQWLKPGADRRARVVDKSPWLCLIPFVCFLLVNRPVRTRMQGCGDWGLDAPGYPIGRQ